jgi:hypothetical protein
VAAPPAPRRSSTAVRAIEVMALQLSERAPRRHRASALGTVREPATKLQGPAARTVRPRRVLHRCAGWCASGRACRRGR